MVRPPDREMSGERFMRWLSAGSIPWTAGGNARSAGLRLQWRFRRSEGCTPRYSACPMVCFYAAVGFAPSEVRARRAMQYPKRLHADEEQGDIGRSISLW